MDLMRQVVSGILQTTPDIETPEYTVLQRRDEYEIRSYKPFVVAETTSGDGGSSGQVRMGRSKQAFGGRSRATLLASLCGCTTGL